jgi:undecaprenyl-diphosphatase
LLGTIISAAVAWVSIGWLLRYVSHSSFIAFGFYRIATGIIILVLIFLRVSPV